MFDEEDILIDECISLMPLKRFKVTMQVVSMEEIKMPRKKNDQDSFDEFFEEEVTEEGPEAERLYEEIVPPVATITVREMRRSGDGRILVDGSDGNFYLLPKDFEFEANRTALIRKDDSRLESLYTWEKEIEAMLPDRAALVKQIRLSLYRAGAFQKGDLKKNEVARNWSRSAFPYQIKEIEE